MFECESVASMKTQRLTGLSKTILLVLALLITIGFVSGNAVASNQQVTQQFEHVTVTSGETLWHLATKHSKGQSQRDWIAALVDLNNLTSSELSPGQRLALPN